MTVKIDKEFTLKFAEKRLKEKIKDFKALFTASDLLRMYNENTNENVEGRILECCVEAFASSTLYSSFKVNMIVFETHFELNEISFYVDETEDIFSFDNDKMLITHLTYKRESK